MLDILLSCFWSNTGSASGMVLGKAIANFSDKPLLSEALILTNSEDNI